jgi:ubiquitin carboxyl-terminal hydrolase 36/42
MLFLEEALLVGICSTVKQYFNYNRTCFAIAVTCLQCGGVSTTFQHCQDLLLDIRRASTLDDALAGYFCKERLDGDDAYHCEQCHRKVSATKKFSLEKPPIVLCIQFKRYVILISQIIYFVKLRVLRNL